MVTYLAFRFPLLVFYDGKDDTTEGRASGKAVWMDGAS